jgi:hypothetical protein
MTFSPPFNPSSTMKSWPAMALVLIGRGATLPSASTVITNWPCGATLHRALRHADRVVELGLREAHANEGAGQKIATRVGEFGAQDYRAGIRVDGQIGELEASLFRIERTVLQHHFDRRRIRLLLLAALDGLLQAQQVGIGLRELDADWVKLFDGARWVASPLPTSAPSVTSARPMRPEIGAGGTAFSRSSLAFAAAASACLTRAWAASNSCWLTALISSSGLYRENTAFAAPGRQLAAQLVPGRFGRRSGTAAFRPRYRYPR